MTYLRLKLVRTPAGPADQVRETLFDTRAQAEAQADLILAGKLEIRQIEGGVTYRDPGSGYEYELKVLPPRQPQPVPVPPPVA